MCFVLWRILLSFIFFLFVFQAKSATANNHRSELGDLSNKSSFSRASVYILKIEKLRMLCKKFYFFKFFFSLLKKIFLRYLISGDHA